MSHFFIRKFKAKHKCQNCHADKKHGYSVCAKHLEYAMKRWRTWSADRRAEGKCCYCDRKSFHGWLRCRVHTKINREKCARWMAEHPDYHAKTYAKRQALRKKGFCPQCQQHRKLRKGEGRCWVCRERNRLRDKVGTAGMHAVIHARYGTKYDRKLISAAA